MPKSSQNKNTNPNAGQYQQNTYTYAPPQRAQILPQQLYTYPTQGYLLNTNYLTNYNLQFNNTNTYNLHLYPSNLHYNTQPIFTNYSYTNQILNVNNDDVVRMHAQNTNLNINSPNLNFINGENHNNVINNPYIAQQAYTPAQITLPTEANNENVPLNIIAEEEENVHSDEAGENRNDNIPIMHSSIQEEEVNQNLNSVEETNKASEKLIVEISSQQSNSLTNSEENIPNPNNKEGYDADTEDNHDTKIERVEIIETHYLPPNEENTHNTNINEDDYEGFWLLNDTENNNGTNQNNEETEYITVNIKPPHLSGSIEELSS